MIFASCVTFCGFFNLGGGISRILRIAWSGGSLKNGGSPSTISITIIPEKMKECIQFLNRAAFDINNLKLYGFIFFM